MRIKRGLAKKQKHKKVLKMAKGYRMSYSKLYRRAKEAVMHAGVYSNTHRAHRKSQKREEWIVTIAAALSGTGMSYSAFIGGLKKQNIEIDRKNLAEMIVSNPKHFEAILAEARKG